MSKREIRFANKIKRYREMKGITKEELAEAIGKSVSTVYQMERTKSFPRGETREKIMEFLEANFDDIYYEVKE